MKIIGIDFGTSTTLVSSNKGPINIANNYPILPSVFELTNDINEDDNSITIIGDNAWRNRGKNTYFNFKPKIGLDETATKKARIWMGKIYAIIKEKYNNASLDEYYIVIGYPVAWKTKQKKTLIQIAKEVGFKNISLVPEPIAAILNEGAYEIEPKAEDRYFLFFDFGGGTLDLSLVEIPQKTSNINFVYCGGEPELGGKDFDKSIVSYCNKKHNLNLDDIEIRDLEQNMNEVKSDLNTAQTASFYFRNKRYELSRDEFNEACKGEIEKLHLALTKFFEGAGKKYKNKITEIIKVGGSSKLHFINNELGIFFGNSKIFDNSTIIINPENTVVAGLPRYFSEREKILESKKDSIKERYDKIIIKWEKSVVRISNNIDNEFKVLWNSKDREFLKDDDSFDNNLLSNKMKELYDNIFKEVYQFCQKKYEHSIKDLEDEIEELIQEAQKLIQIKFGRIDTKNEISSHRTVKGEVKYQPPTYNPDKTLILDLLRNFLSSKFITKISDTGIVKNISKYFPKNSFKVGASIINHSFKKTGDMIKTKAPKNIISSLDSIKESKIGAKMAEGGHLTYQKVKILSFEKVLSRKLNEYFSLNEANDEYKDGGYFYQIKNKTKYPSFEKIWDEYKNNFNIGGYYEGR